MARVGAGAGDVAGTIAAQAGIDFQANAPSASAGIAAMTGIAQSDLAGQLSSAGKLAISGISLASNELADGDLESAAAVAAAGAIVTASYAMGESMIEAGLGQIAAVVGNVSAAVPILGAIVNVFLNLSQYPAGQYSPAEIQQKCEQYYGRVTFGNGGKLTGTDSSTVLPADIFMGNLVAYDGRMLPDVFGWQPYNAKPAPGTIATSTLRELLQLLEEPIPEPNSASAKAAKVAWPNAGLSQEQRIRLKQLRLGISAGYVNASIDRMYTPSLADGGTTMWPVYADLLVAAFRAQTGVEPGSDKSRIPKDWVRWRFLQRNAAQAAAGSATSTDSADKLGPTFDNGPTPALLFANYMAARAKGAPGPSDPLGAVAKYIQDNDENFTLAFGNCAVFDFDRVWVDFYALVDGWYKGVYAPAPGYDFPSSVEGDNSAKGKAPLWPWLAIAAAVGGVFYATVRPAEAARLVASGNGALRSAGAAAGRAAGQAATAVRGWGKRVSG